MLVIIVGQITVKPGTVSIRYCNVRNKPSHGQVLDYKRQTTTMKKKQKKNGEVMVIDLIHFDESLPDNKCLPG